MQSFLAKCAALGIVAGGFTLTGDLGRLADRGRRLIDATGVPTDGSPGHAAPAAAPAGPAPLAAAPAPAPVPAPTPAGSAQPAAAAHAAVAPVKAQARPLPGDVPPDAPVGRPVPPLPSSGGVAAVDLRQIAPGSRVLVWVRRPGAAALGHGDRELIALDVIDPSTGEALEHRPAAVGDRSPSHAVPRRVAVAADQPGRIARGDALRLAPVRGVNGTGSVEEIGRVLAIDLPSQ
jgi:hypothetical protein